MKDIEIRGLSKSFGQKVAVDNISLDVEQGELLGLLGVNGAGKTTTIRLLSCLSRPSGGDALICGHSIVHDGDYNDKNRIKTVSSTDLKRIQDLKILVDNMDYIIENRINPS